MNKWLALFLIVIAVILNKHIMAWLSLQKAKSAEKIAKNELERTEAEERRAGLNKLEAEAKQLTAQLQKQTAERIAGMSTEQIETYKRAIDQNCENCRMRYLMYPQFITQQVIPQRFW